MLDVNLLGFLAVVGFVVAATVWAIERLSLEQREGLGPVARRPRLFAAGWLALSGAPTLAGLLAPVGPIPPQALMVPVIGAAIWFSASSIGSAIAAVTPLHLLIGFQAFRLPLEIVLHGWVESGVAPPQMTWTGSNIDIVAGVVALVSIPLVRRWARLGWVPTALGSALLLNVMVIVVRSLPGPLMTYTDPITLPNRFPHVWIATVCVAGALAGHIIAVRALAGWTGTAEA